MSEPEKPDATNESPKLALAEVLGAKPPGAHFRVSDCLKSRREAYGSPSLHVVLPLVRIPCDSEECNGFQLHSPVQAEIAVGSIDENLVKEYLLTYICRHCQGSVKVFAIEVSHGKNEPFCMIQKFGETPAYGPPTPPKLKAMVEQDRDAFMKGRRCELQNLGIGAFAYYRRVVEHQKNRLIGEIIKVAKMVGAPAEMISALENAKGETQFTKAIGEIKVPESLLIKGENPLTILHHALSEGLHAESDEDCLELAQTIRIVLAELSERMASILSDDRDLTDAVGKLMARRSQKAAQKPKQADSANNKEA